MPCGLVHSRARVVDREAYVFRRRSRAEHVALRVADPGTARFEPQHAAIRHRVPRVVHEIQQDLLDGVAVGPDLREIFVGKDEQLDIRGQHPPQHGGQIVQEMAEMHRLEGQGRAAGKSEQLVHHEAAADRRRDDVAQARFVGTAGQELGVGEDDRQQVVEIVRDSTGELTDRFHLLGLTELFLQAASLADVLGEHFVALDAAVLVAHGAAVQPHRDRLAILAAPYGLRLDGARRGVHLHEIAGARRRLLEHVPVEILAQQLGLRLVT